MEVQEVLAGRKLLEELRMLINEMSSPSDLRRHGISESDAQAKFETIDQAVAFMKKQYAEFVKKD